MNSKWFSSLYTGLLKRDRNHYHHSKFQQTLFQGRHTISSIVDDQPGLHKTPIVNELWELRKRVLRDKELASKAKEKKFENARVNATKSDELPRKQRNHSHTSVTYNFSTNKELRSKYINPWGMVRMGRILEDLDALAGTIAFKHCQNPHEETDNLLIVTAAIDRIALAHRADVQHDVTLEGSVSWTGRSSMDIKMRATSSWTQEPFLEASFLFVARDASSGLAAPVNPLLPGTAQEQRDWEQGDWRNQARKRQRRLSSNPREKLLEGGTVSVHEAAGKLANEGRALVDLPSLAGGRVLQEHTRLENAMIMQPQQVNTAQRVFGGYLVRKAYELAFATAYMFCGQVPRFIEVGEVTFQQPVDVGDLVRFQSQVLYCSAMPRDGRRCVHVEVRAHVVKPELVQVKQSNSFYFTFAAPEGTRLQQVLPRTMEDAVRVVERIQADAVQSSAISSTESK